MSSSDVKDAFLTSKFRDRELCARPPKEGILGVPAGPSIELLKGCFGLQGSPRLWWLGLQDIALSVGFEPVRGCPATFVPQKEGRVAGMMVIHVDGGTWAGSGKAFLGAQGIMRKLLKIRKEEFRTLYLLGRQVTTEKVGTIKVDSIKYVSSLKPVHVPAARRKNSSQSLAGKEMTQYRSLVQQLAWPAKTAWPSFAYEVSELQQRTSEATVSDLVRANFVLRATQEKTRQGHGLWFRKSWRKIGMCECS